MAYVGIIAAYLNPQPAGERGSMVDGAAGQEELPSSTPNGTSGPASAAGTPADDGEKASEWRLKGNDDFKSGKPDGRRQKHDACCRPHAHPHNMARPCCSGAHKTHERISSCLPRSSCLLLQRNSTLLPSNTTPGAVHLSHICPDCKAQCPCILVSCSAGCPAI